MTTPDTDAMRSTRTMTAVVQSSYGEPYEALSIQDVDVPEPNEGQVLVKVHTSSVNALDWHYVSGTPMFLRLFAGLRTPKRRIPGADIAGTVVAVAPGVSRLKPGDSVFGVIPGGGFAEYATVREGLLAPTPSNLPPGHSAALGVAALTALQGLRDWGGLKPGQSVLINGASGGVGTFAIQIAKALGASQVTAVCSTRNMEAARDLGADHVFDYTKEDFVQSGQEYDILFDNAGSTTLSECRSILSPEGTLVLVTGKKGKWISPMPRILAAGIRSRFWTQTAVNQTATSTPEDLMTLREMVESGQVTPAIERTIPLEDAIAAIEDQGRFHARAKTLVSVGERV